MPDHCPDHGGALDAAVGRYGGARDDWLDLSTGVNPTPYPVGKLNDSDWTALPDAGAQTHLFRAARAFWNVPDGADIIAAPGASALIARLPALRPVGTVRIKQPTYNEHAAAFEAAGWRHGFADADVRVVVHPNNPDGQLFLDPEARKTRAGLLIIDESFCDTMPEQSHVELAANEGVIILKSFGKFWGLAGVRLGFAIGAHKSIAPLRTMLGPWAVSGPALKIGARALGDHHWARSMRTKLKTDAARLDTLMSASGAKIVGGTPLFRLFDVSDAARLYDHLAKQHILGRIFPYSTTWLRLGLPSNEGDWQRLQEAIRTIT